MEDNDEYEDGGWAVVSTSKKVGLFFLICFDCSNLDSSYSASLTLRRSMDLTLRRPFVHPGLPWVRGYLLIAITRGHMKVLFFFYSTITNGHCF